MQKSIERLVDKRANIIGGKTTACVCGSMVPKPKTLLYMYFILQFRVENDLHVVTYIRKPCISTCLTEETLIFLNYLAHFRLRKLKIHRAL